MPVDSAARNPEFQRLIRLQTEAFARNTPYHSLELNDGTVIPGLISVDLLKARLDRYPLPQDLRGKRVLDIGAASGWNSFECERRGAEVVAIDCVEYDELLAVKRLRESRLEYAIIDMEELTPERFGFSITCCSSACFIICVTRCWGLKTSAPLRAAWHLSSLM